MEIKFNGTDYMLTTEHPLSSYGLGILTGPTGDYMPSDALPASKEACEVFGDDLPPMLAGEFVVAWASKKIMSDAEIDFIRLYLSQDPQRRFTLPYDLELRRKQCENQLDIEMGDTSQGAHWCYWALSAAKVSVMLYEITGGRFVFDSGEVRRTRD